MPKMYETVEESDEDCEVYFLKPVNEYNISEKIKEANKELFADIAPGAKYTYSNIDIANEDGSIIQQRKVTFAPNLEIYESDSVVKLRDTEYLDDECVGEVRSAKQNKSTAKSKFTIINEEPFLEEEQTDIEEECMVTVVPPQSPQHTTSVSDDHDNELEKICEEIFVMDMKELSPPGRRMLKQNTFDFDDELYPVMNSVVEVEDTKSLTNLAVSDCEDDEETQKQALKEALNYQLTDEEGDIEEEDDEDDQLSLIVASYLPPKYEHGYRRSNSLSPEPRSNTTIIGKATTKPRCAKFGKRFALRRKAINSTNTIGVHSSGRHEHSATEMPYKEMTDLKLNYKICCECRNAAPLKLPKYTGYLSEYGLTREQLAQRDEEIQRKQRKQRSLLQQTLRSNERKMHKLQDNHRAFISWLRSKMRFPINKTRNMYDVRSSSSSISTDSTIGCRIGCSGTSGGRNLGATTKKRSAYDGKNKK